MIDTLICVARETNELPVIRVEAEQLLIAVKQMQLHELDAFVTHVLGVRAQREAPMLSADESALLLRINNAIPAALQQRYDALVTRRDAESLTMEEHAGLLELTTQIEQREADRIAALAALARVRGTSLSDLMHTLGIQASYA